jgi:MFS family permease
MVPRPWLMLAAGVAAQASTTIVVTAPAFLIPLLHTERGLSLAEAGLLASAPNLGLVFALVAWGAATDRWGERRVLVAGPAITVCAVVAACFAQGYVALGAALVVAGIGAASTSAASGRVIVGWFAKERRGFAMGIRQTSQPVGVAIGAVAVPALVSTGSLVPALVFSGVLVLLSAVFCAAVIVDPVRPPRAAGSLANPYRRDATLARIHLVSVLLVVPQFALAIFGFVWLVVDLGWNELAAGFLVAAAQLLGAGGRIAVGVLSDRVGSRLRPLRWVAVAGIVAMGLTAAAGALHLEIIAAVFFVIATCVSVADNGLAFTAVAELAGPHWSGRALGAQNTGQFIAATIVGPALGTLIAVVGYPAAFALSALAPAIATPLVPPASKELHHD